MELSVQSRLACGLKYGTVAIFDSSTGELLRELPNPQEQSQHPNDFYSLAFLTA